MSFSSKDIIPFSQVRSHLTELAESVSAGHEKLITRNGESYIAIIAADRLDHYHRLEREHIHLQLLDEAVKGLNDIKMKKFHSVVELKNKYNIKKIK